MDINDFVLRRSGYFNMNNQWIIEINYSLDDKDNIRDYQIRIIECENWNKYIKNYIDHNKRPSRIEFKTVFGYLPGASLVETDIIEEDIHMSIDYFSCILKKKITGMRTKRVAINYNRLVNTYERV